MAAVAAPILPLLLSVVALACVATAAWRLRNRANPDGPGKVAPAAGEATGESR